MGIGSFRQAQLVQAVRNSPLLGTLARDELGTVLGCARSTRAGRGEMLRRVDDDAVLVLLEGAAVTSLATPLGGSVVTQLLGPGDLSGLPVVLGQVEGDVDVVAVEPSEALLIGGSDYRRLLRELPSLALATMRALAAEVAEANREAARFSDTSTTDRVLDRLVHLAERWSVETDHGLRITIPLTQEMLASWARSSRESTAKVLHDLRRARVIRTARRELTIMDLDRLRSRRRDLTTDAHDAVRTLLRSIG